MSRKPYVTSVSGITYTRARIKAEKRAYRISKREERKKARAIRVDKSRANDVERDFSGVSVLGVFFVLVFVVNFFYAVTGSDSFFSFTSLLSTFEKAPSINTDWILKFGNLKITDDWTKLFNWLRDFINDYIIKIITIVLYLCTGVAQLVTYFCYFVGILFGGVK